MLRRKRNSLTSSNCTLRDGKLCYVCWAMRWSGYAALEGEELHECQLYVEGRERSYLSEGIVGLCCVGRGTA
jgi:hypothetical protein